MNKATYVQTQLQLRSLAQMVVDMPLHEFIQAAEQAETIGPIVHPTLYRQASENLGKIKHLAQALLPFQKAVKDAPK